MQPKPSLRSRAWTAGLLCAVVAPSLAGCSSYPRYQSPAFPGHVVPQGAPPQGGTYQGPAMMVPPGTMQLAPTHVQPGASSPVPGGMQPAPSGSFGGDAPPFYPQGSGGQQPTGNNFVPEYRDPSDQTDQTDQSSEDLFNGTPFGANHVPAFESTLS